MLPEREAGAGVGVGVGQLKANASPAQHHRHGGWQTTIEMKTSVSQLINKGATKGNYMFKFWVYL